MARRERLVARRAARYAGAMVGRSLETGLAVWRGAAVRLAAGLACSAFVVVVCYTFIAAATPGYLVGQAVFLVPLGLALAGWWRFCARAAEEGRVRWLDLAAGLRRPDRALIAGLAPPALLSAPWWMVWGDFAPLLPPSWPWWIGGTFVFVGGVLLAPLALAIPFALMEPDGGAAKGGSQARWRSGMAAGLVIAAIGCIGPGLWVLMEDHVVGPVMAGLPLALEPFGPGLVRAAGVAAVLATAPAASCVWAAWDRAARPG